MLEKAQCGISFPMQAIMKVYNWLDKLASEEQGFYAVMHFLRILYELSLYDDAKVLSSSSFAKIETFSDSRRVQKVQQIYCRSLSGRHPFEYSGGYGGYDTGFVQPFLPFAYREDAFRLYYRYSSGVCYTLAGGLGAYHCRNLL